MHVRKALVSGILGVSLALSIAGTANAYCLVDNLQWDDGGDHGLLQIHCINDAWYSASTASFCGPHTTDTLKAWLSMAQAAWLSGKHLQMTWDSKSGCGYDGRHFYILNLLN